MEAQLRTIPKIELHCHLDGSVSFAYLIKQAEKQHIPVDLRHVTAKETCESLDEYLKCFDEILKVMQTADSLTDAVVDVSRQAHEDGVKYLELRFAPMQHTEHGLTLEAIFHAVCQGAAQAEADYGMTVRLIICGMKHHSDETNIEMFETLAAYKQTNKYIVGTDLAGSENDFPTHVKTALIKLAKSMHHLTLHAGECGCNKNVYDAITLGATRIGHGVSSFEDPALLALLREKNVLLEICPKSNLQTKAIANIKQLDLQTLIDMGVPFVINTDNRTVTQTNLVSEYQLLINQEQLNMDDIYNINANALNYGFLSEADKQHIQETYFRRHPILK